MRPKTNVYVDGFNLYNGLRRRAKQMGLDAPEHRWLNLSKLAVFLLPDTEIQVVHYFTARVKRRIEDPDVSVRQQVFFRALRTLGTNLEIHEGYFQRNKPWRRLVDNPAEAVRVVDYKEKGSDVALATQLLVDAYEGNCERGCVISNDSDLVRPIAVAAAKFPFGVIVFNPQPGPAARKLRAVATEYRPMRRRTFRACVFPDELEDANGVFHKPDSW